MVLLTSFLELPARLCLDDVDDDDAEEEEGPEAAQWRKGMLASWQGALAPLVPALAVSLVLGLLGTDGSCLRGRDTDSVGRSMSIHDYLTTQTKSLDTGTAPEPTLDTLAQLLRALLCRFPDGVLGILQPFVVAAASTTTAAAAADQAPPPGVPPEAAQALVQQLRAHPWLQLRLLPLLQKAVGRGGAGSRGSSTAGAWMDLSMFRDLGCDVWAFCQGTKGADCLDRYL